MLKKCGLLLMCGLVVGTGAELAWADEPRAAEGQRPLVSQVQALMAVKCAECHGGGGSRPRTGMTLNLQELAANARLVVPFQPDRSRLWLLVRDGVMPEEGSKAGPLTQAEKETVRRWIASGAPVPPSPSLSLSPSPSPEEAVAVEPDGAPTMPLGRRFLRWLGKFHVLVIHFPIALLATAAGMELFFAVQGNREPSPLVRVCLLLGAAGAVVAVVLGWLHADSGGAGAGSNLLPAHRWLGTVAGLLAIVLTLWSEVETRRARRSWQFRFLLWPVALLLGAAAHVGGILVHGDRFFDW